MRLERVVPAVAIVLSLLLPATPTVAAEHGASAVIVSPGGGATIGPRANVTFDYAGYHGPRAQGYLTLDGAWAGAFDVALLPTPLGIPTRVNATLNATGFSSGAHQLSVHVYTANDTPVDAAPVTIVLDHPPTFTASATYDHDARAVHVHLSVFDDGAAPPSIRVDAGNRSANASFAGSGTVVVPADHRPGNYSANVTVTDAIGQRATGKVPYVVTDRPAHVASIDARYELGGRLAITAQLSDPDGGISWVEVMTPLGSGHLDDANGTWDGTVGVRPRLGDHEGVLRIHDAYGSFTEAPFHFVIGGAREVIFERTIDTYAGAYADVSLSSLPSVLDGRIDICIQNCDQNATWVGGPVITVVVWQGVAPPGNEYAPRTCIAVARSTSCEFDIHGAYGWNADIAWSQIAMSHASVRISGIRV